MPHSRRSFLRACAAAALAGAAPLLAGCVGAPPASPSPTLSPDPTASPSPTAPVATPPAASPTPAPPATPTATPAGMPVRPGIEVLVAEQPELVAGKRLGLITNQTGVSAALKSDAELLNSVAGAKVVALFAGEHGPRGAEPAGKKLAGSSDPYLGVPVYSLYGGSLAPRPEWLRGLDALIFDIQNVGSAAYTYKFTMSFAMEAAAKAGLPFLVLDRPNPTGGEVVEGPLLPAKDIWRHPLPLRHGLTNGELAAMWNEEYRMGAQLTVVKMRGWRRELTWDETGLPWVATSPNIPTADTALAYAGQVLLEDVNNVSEGRGTTRPFLQCGAPWVDAVAAAADLNARRLAGVMFRPAYFQPAPGEKYAGQMCAGVDLYFTDRRAYRALPTTLSILDAFRRSAGGKVRLAASGAVPPLAEGESLTQRLDAYQPQLRQFLATRQRYLLY